MMRINSISYRAVQHLPRLRPTGITSSQLHPLWCDVQDTPWGTAMRAQVATATIVGGRFARAWRFCPVDQGFPGNHEYFQGQP